MKKVREIGKQICYLCENQYESKQMVQREKVFCQFELQSPLLKKGVYVNAGITLHFVDGENSSVKYCKGCAKKVTGRFTYKLKDPVVASGDLTFSIPDLEA